MKLTALLSLLTLFYSEKAKCQHVDKNALLKNYAHYLETVDTANINDSKNQGSCFIVNKNGKYFLISSNHLLSGRAPFTGEKVLPIPNKIYLRLYAPQVKDFAIQEIPLFKSGKPLYIVLSVDDDVAIIQILPDSKFLGYNQFVNFDQLDNRTNIQHGKEAVIVGFDKNCKEKKSLVACLNYCKTSRQIKWSPRNHYVFLKIKTFSGSSGSPIFLRDKRGEYPKIIGINSMGNELDQGATSMGLYSNYIIELINRLEK